MSGELNKQIKELQARVKNAENSIVAHHQALSAVSQALSSNPFTMSAGKIGEMFYAYSPASFLAMVKLVGAGIPSFNDIMNQLSSALESAVDQTIDQVEQQIENMIVQQIQAIEAMIDQLTNQINGFIDQIASLEQSIIGMLDGPEKTAKLQQIASAQANLAAAQLQLTVSQGSLASLQSQPVKAVATQAANFILSQNRLAKQKSDSLDISTGP